MRLATIQFSTMLMMQNRLRAHDFPFNGCFLPECDPAADEVRISSALVSCLADLYSTEYVTITVLQTRYVLLFLLISAFLFIKIGFTPLRPVRSPTADASFSFLDNLFLRAQSFRTTISIRWKLQRWLPPPPPYVDPRSPAYLSLSQRPCKYFKLRRYKATFAF